MEETLIGLQTLNQSFTMEARKGITGEWPHACKLNHRDQARRPIRAFRHTADKMKSLHKGTKCVRVAAHLDHDMPLHAGTALLVAISPNQEAKCYMTVYYSQERITHSTV